MISGADMIEVKMRAEVERWAVVSLLKLMVVLSFSA